MIKMEDYHLDRATRKEVLIDGPLVHEYPRDLATCYIRVERPQCAVMTVQQVKDELHSEIFDECSEKVIIIGEASSTADRMLERAIQTMRKGEQSLITAEVPLYNEEAQSVELSLVVTLVNADYFKLICDWSVSEKYEYALRRKQQGVELFRVNRHIDAFMKFTKACKTIISMEPIKPDEPLRHQIIELKHVLYNNMAECQLLRNNFEYALTLCNKVLANDANNVKAIYRRGVAYAGLLNYEQATNDLKTVLTLEPKNTIALEKYKIFSEKYSQNVQGYENIVRKMFEL